MAGSAGQFVGSTRGSNGNANHRSKWFHRCFAGVAPPGPARGRITGSSERSSNDTRCGPSGSSVHVPGTCPFRQRVASVNGGITCRGIGELVRFSKRIGGAGGRRVLCSLHPHPPEVFRLLKLDALFPIFPDAPAALDSLAA